MLQTATHIFGLALAMSSAFAPRIQNRQEGTMAFTSSYRIATRMQGFASWNIALRQAC
jgi:hypothetical protein